MGTPITVVKTTFVPVPIRFPFSFVTVFAAPEADFADAAPETVVVCVTGFFIYTYVHIRTPLPKHTFPFA